MSIMKIDRTHSLRTLHMGCGEQLSLCDALLKRVQQQEARHVDKAHKIKREVKQ